jgi:hypothetical protein
MSLIVHSDDDGRMKANPKHIKALIYPFDHGLRTDDLQESLCALHNAKLISLYQVDGKDYLYHPNWEKWQPIRKDRYKPSDCPPPPPQNPDGNQMATRWQPVVDTTQPNLTRPNQIKSMSASPPVLRIVNRFCFETVWKQYPRRIGTKLAKKHFQASVKTEQDYEAIQAAMRNYLASDTVKNGFVQHGNTWFNNWRDWIANPIEKTEAERLSEIEKKMGMKCITPRTNTLKTFSSI